MKLCMMVHMCPGFLLLFMGDVPRIQNPIFLSKFWSLIDGEYLENGKSQRYMSITVNHVNYVNRQPSFVFLSEAVRMHNTIALSAPMAASSGASHIPAVRSSLPLSSWNSADVPCWEPSPDI